MIYLHLQYHYKKNNEMQILEIDYHLQSKQSFQQICDIRQPMVFHFTFPEELKNKIQEKTSALLQIRNKDDDKHKNTELYTPLSLEESVLLFENDVDKKYWTENNNSFLRETNVYSLFKKMEKKIEPEYCYESSYDILFGSDSSKTPLQYKLNYRNYFLCIEDSVQIELLPPESSLYLNPYNNYEYLYFETNQKSPSMQLKSTTITLKKGEMMFLPAFWWYSIQNSKSSILLCFYYKTIMNYFAISPYLILQHLQKSSIHKFI
jgi:hypothetical protein